MSYKTWKRLKSAFNEVCVEHRYLIYVIAARELG